VDFTSFGNHRTKSPNLKFFPKWHYYWLLHGVLFHYWIPMVSSTYSLSPCNFSMWIILLIKSHIGLASLWSPTNTKCGRSSLAYITMGPSWWNNFTSSLKSQSTILELGHYGVDLFHYIVHWIYCNRIGSLCIGPNSQCNYISTHSWIGTLCFGPNLLYIQSNSLETLYNY